MPKLEEIDALRIGVKNSLVQENYPRLLQRLERLKILYGQRGSGDGEVNNIDALIEAVRGYHHATTRPSSEDYMHGAEGAMYVSREEEVQERQNAASAPTRLELEAQEAYFLEKIRGIPFRQVDDVCWIDGKSAMESRCFNSHIEGTPINLCGEHAVDYQVRWRIDVSPVSPDVARYARETNPQLFELLMTHSS